METIQANEQRQVRYIIPLLPYEETLLKEVGKFLASEEAAALDIGQPCSPAEAFEDWRWFQVLSSWLVEELDPECIKDYGGDRPLAYDRCLQALTNQDDNERNLYRINKVRQQNPTFLERLGDRDSSDITFVQSEADSQSWITLSRIVNAFGRPWRRPDTFDDDGEHFEIWQLVRIFFVHARCPNNADLINESLVQDPAFLACFEVSEDEVSQTSESSSGNYSGQLHADLSTDSISQRLMQDPQFQALFHVGKNGNDEISQVSTDPSSGEVQVEPLFEHLPIRKRGRPKMSLTPQLDIEQLLRQVAQDRKYQDPRAYVPFIPWSGLEPVTQDTLTSAGINLDLLLRHGVDIRQWALWQPTSNGYGENHHLFVEDEIFAYSIEKNWPLPGHLLQNRIIFGVQNLQECSLVEDLGNFWREWNDCAITTRDDGAVGVLQTIPGIHLRLRKAQLDYQAALGYYRNIVETHAFGTLSDTSVKDALSLGDGYNSLYENSLRSIPDPCSELRELNWESPIGRGSNGAVYAATWHRKQGILATSHPDDVPVVLKDILSRKSSDAAEKFMKEASFGFYILKMFHPPITPHLDGTTYPYTLLTLLDATWFALGSATQTCVQFYGIAKVEISTAYRYMLVFERATQGSILEFLDQELLKGLPFSDYWVLMCSALEGISDGLRWIHQHRVVHRDLHPGNVFVTDRTYRLDPNMPHEYIYILGDLGEGKRLGPYDVGQRNPHASYGAVDYRAPELRGGGFDSNDLSANVAAETFSFGVLACTILSRACSALLSDVPDDILEEAKASSSHEQLSEEVACYLVPTRVRDAVGPCLSRSPSMRPSMKKVERELEDLWYDLKQANRGDEVEEPKKISWCYWNWDDDLRAATGMTGLHNNDTRTGETSATLSYDENDI